MHLQGCFLVMVMGKLGGRHFMQDRPDGLFLVLKESLVEHVGGVSSLNHTFWKGDSFVDSLFLRQLPIT